MYTISRLARRFGVSRSTLIYYDKIGLLVPSGRSESNYRLYSASDVERMQRIAVYRDAGVPLQAIKEMLAAADDSPLAVLGSRLTQINREIAQLRRQQCIIRRLLRDEADLPHDRSLDKKRWVEILSAAGLSEEDMRTWHVEFERMAPGAHQDFLESLGIDGTEIDEIRGWSKRAG